MKKVILGVAVLVACAALFYWQHRSIRQLRAENAALDAAASELDLLREEAEELRKSQIDPAEVERARQAQAELLRLRGEVSQLREQLKTAQQANRAAERKDAAVPAPVTEASASPVETYSATLRATLAPQQTLATGGWLMPNGKRGIVLVEPAIISNAGGTAQVMIQTRFVELSDDALASVGLAGLKSQGKESTSQSILELEQSRLLIQSLETTPGVNVLSAPRVSTSDGRQARVSVTNRRTIDGAEYEVGPTLDVLPQVTPDGKSVEMTIIAQMRLESNLQK